MGIQLPNPLTGLGDWLPFLGYFQGLGVDSPVFGSQLANTLTLLAVMTTLPSGLGWKMRSGINEKKWWIGLCWDWFWVKSCWVGVWGRDQGLEVSTSSISFTSSVTIPLGGIVLNFWTLNRMKWETFWENGTKKVEGLFWERFRENEWNLSRLNTSDQIVVERKMKKNWEKIKQVLKNNRLDKNFSFSFSLC
jgi:hypothetical protein